MLRRRHAALALSDGRVIVAGGQVAGAAAELDSAELWEPRSDTWQLVHPMSATRQDFSLIRLGDGRVMVAGGTAGRQVTPEVWDPKTDSWTFTGPPAGLTHGEERLVPLRDGRVMLVDVASTQMWSAR